jgi:DNA mismatch endonuclease (patch repair protein)
MADKLSKDARSALMGRVKQKDTEPEITVRKSLHAMGYRFRLHRKDLPGRPDIVLPKHKAVVFVHGCFWHGHSCNRGRLPATNVDFWQDKIAKNRERDRKAVAQLESLGYRVLVVWECDTREAKTLNGKLERFFELGER